MSDAVKLQKPTAPARATFGQVLRFGVVGVGATLTHAASLSAIVEIAGLSAVPANGIAFLIASLVTYLGQSLWVFDVSDHSYARIRNFLVVAASGFLANLAIMAGAVELAGLHYLVGFAAATALIPTVTFLANKFWVFSRRA